jgi:hypothetical protein
VESWLDEKPLVNWAGNPESLQSLFWGLPDLARPGIGGFDVEAVFHSVRFCLLSGKGVRLPPGDKVAPMIPVDDASGYGEFSDWMSGPEYQEQFKTLAQQGTFPCIVEGKTGPLFRAKFVPKPSADFKFFSFHGISQSQYDAQTGEYRRQGFRELSITSFVDATGTRRLSGTWVNVADAVIRDRM